MKSSILEGAFRFSCCGSVDRRVLLFAFLVIGWCLSPLARGDSVVETCTEESLRNALLNGGKVTFACDGVIQLTSTIPIQTNTTMDASSRNVVLDGANEVRLFTVNTGVTFSVRGVRLTGGSAPQGAGILNQGGSLILDNVVFQKNVASKVLEFDLAATGAAVCCLGGSVFATNCIFEGNVAFGEPRLPFPQWQAPRVDGFGGAIFLDAGSGYIRGCTFTGNRAEGYEGTLGGPNGFPGYTGAGGAIYVGASGELSVEESYFFGNVARGGPGRPGGIWSVAYPGGEGGSALGGAICSWNNLRVNRCAFEGNQAVGGHGGAGGGDVDIVGANGADGGLARGAAIHASGYAQILNSSMTFNTGIGGNGGGGGNSGGKFIVGPDGHGGQGGQGGAAQGGGLAILTGSCVVMNCTLAVNSLTGGNGASGGSLQMCSRENPRQRGGDGGDGGNGGETEGAGAYLLGTNIYFTSVTIASNTITAGVGGAGGLSDGCFETSFTNGLTGSQSRMGGSALAAAPDTGVSLRNSLLGFNHGALNSLGVFFDEGSNLSADSSLSAAVSSTRTGLDPGLGALVVTGATAFFPLLPNSMAIDAAACSNSIESDQRGAPRPHGPACDIGAYEYDGVLEPLVFQLRFSTDTVRPGRTARLRAELHNPNSSAAAGATLAVELPLPLVLAPTPNVVNSCGEATIVAEPGTKRLDVRGMTLAPHASCAIEVDIAALSPGIWTLENCTLSASGYGVRSVEAKPSIRAVAAPSVTTSADGNWTPTSVFLTGLANPNGAATLSGFAWGTSPDLGGFVSAQDLGNGFDPQTFSASLLGLEPNTVYYYRAVATNSESVSYGELLRTSTLGGRINNCVDESLRANVAAGYDVRFECDGVIALSDTITLAADTVFDARGHAVVLSGSQVRRLIHVLPGVQVIFQNITFADGLSTNGGAIFNEGGRVTFVDCLFSNNVARGLAGLNGTNGVDWREAAASGLPGDAARGGAVFNAGIIAASNCRFVFNRAVGGPGGLGGNGANGEQVLDARRRCVFGTRGGHSGAGGTGGPGLGGAIHNEGTALVTNATFTYNVVSGGDGGASGVPGREGCGVAGAVGRDGPSGGDGHGGAIHNSGFLRLVASVLADNTAVGGIGGAGSPEVGSLVDPREGGTGGQGTGGGISNDSTNECLNVTVVGNRAIGGPGGPAGRDFFGHCSWARTGNGGIAAGGAVDNRGVIALTNCTLWTNPADGGMATNTCLPAIVGEVFGASIRVATNGWATLVNTIVGSAGPSGSNCFGALFDAGHNLCSDLSAGFSAPGSLNGVDPLLGVLGDYGGTTASIALLPNSPAIDAGDDASCPPVDQREIPRSYGWHCDIGAFEVLPDFFRLTTLTPSQTQLGVQGIGIPAQNFSLESSLDLLNWSEVDSGTVSTDGRFEFFLDRPHQPVFFRTKSP